MSFGGASSPAAAQVDCSVGPSPNADISGIGVRISFYAQAILLALLSARSKEQAEITDALTTLVVTNLAYSVATLYLGFNPNASLNLYDALAVVYLLLCSWTSIFFTLPRYNRFRKYDPHVKFLAVFQSYLVFAVTLTIFISAPTFGDMKECNVNAKVVIFGPLSAVGSGRILGLVGISVLALFYTTTVLMDYRGKWPWSKRPRESQQINARSGGGTSRNRDAHRRTRNRTVSMPEPVLTDAISPSVGRLRTLSNRTAVPAGSAAAPDSYLSSPSRDGAGASENLLPPGFSSGIDGTVFLTVLAILIVSTLGVVNAELLRFYNHPQAEDSEWGFGQILPMFLIVLPLKRTVQAFWTHGLGRRTPAQRGHRMRLRPKTIPDGRPRTASEASGLQLPTTGSFGMPSSSIMSPMFMTSRTTAPASGVEEPSATEDEDQEKNTQLSDPSPLASSVNVANRV